MKSFDEKPHMVPMTREFLSLDRRAHSHYVARLEEDRINKEKKKKETQEKAAKKQEEERVWATSRKASEDIVNKEKKLNVEETKHTEMLDVRADLFKEANVKLKGALKTKDMKQIGVAQAMLDTAETRTQLQ